MRIGYFAAGRGSARISSHFPKRTITSSGSEAKKSIPGIMSSISGGIALVAARAARSDSSPRPSIDAENARKP